MTRVGSIQNKYPHRFSACIPYLRKWVMLGTGCNAVCSAWQPLLLPLLDTYICFSFVQLQAVNFGGQDCILLLEQCQAQLGPWFLHGTSELSIKETAGAINGSCSFLAEPKGWASLQTLSASSSNWILKAAPLKADRLHRVQKAWDVVRVTVLACPACREGVKGKKHYKHHKDQLLALLSDSGRSWGLIVKESSIYMQIS